MELAYGLFMAEAEGYLDTHYNRVGALIRDLKMKQKLGAEEVTIDSSYLRQFGLTFTTLSNADWRRINQEINHF